MSWKSQYEIALKTLLSNREICRANRDLFKRFFEFQEYKLKRTNGLSALDQGCHRTLYGYILRFGMSTSGSRTSHGWT